MTFSKSDRLNDTTSFYLERVSLNQEGVYILCNYGDRTMHEVNESRLTLSMIGC